MPVKTHEIRIFRSLKTAPASKNKCLKQKF